MRRAAIQIAVLTAIFAGVYVGLRAIPATNCQFLHYDQTVVTADGLEYCGAGKSLFMDLTRLNFPVSLKLTADAAPALGQTAHYTLELVTTDGRTLRPSELALTHTRLLHVLVIDPTLEDYQHIHPEPDGDSGRWSFSFAPARAGTYKIYAEFVPAVSLRQVVGATDLVVPGAPEHGVIRGFTPNLEDGYTITLTTPSGAPAVNVDLPLTLSVTRADGAPVKLEPVMGALAHLVAFDQGHHGYAHLHPVQTGHETDPRQPQLSFVYNTALPGRYRLWAQVQLDGRERFLPFDIDVKAD